ncbi:HtaA domain-containing protein [Streptomyces phytohabitans]|uniref:HtaA domain-containing protein n=1 Tax=Streptomyces phytohabitans TaxID=1150371 RepID=UPI00345C047C
MTPNGLTRPGTALAAATATVLAATAFLTLPATAADGAARDRTGERAPAAIDLTDGTLDWGVKKSFRDYVTGPIGGGEITVGDGAALNADGTFRFTDGTGSYDQGSHGVDVAFQGSVHFTAHGGQLDLTFADLKVTSDDGVAGAITADVSSGGTTRDDVEVASLDLGAVEPGHGDGGGMTFADVPATLTAEGAEAFNGFYEEGEALDSATLAVTPAAGGTQPGGTGGGGTGGDSGNGANGSGTNGTSGTGTTGTSGTTGATGTSGDDSGTGSADPASGPGSGSGESAADGTVVDGTLDWGVKKSFRSYVTGPIGGGRIDLSGGARDNGDGYRFAGGSGDLDTEAATLGADFDGAVRFLAHKEDDAYALDLKFSALRVETDGTKGSLVADVSSKDRTTGEVSEYDAVAVAALEVPEGALTPEKDVVTLSKLPASLTKEGVEAFGGFYQEGDALDPVTVSVALDEGARLPGAGSGGPGGSSDASDGGTGATGGSSGPAGTVGGTDLGSLASTGSGAPVAGLLGAAGALALTGAAAAYATRRRVARS